MYLVIFVSLLDTHYIYNFVNDFLFGKLLESCIMLFVTLNHMNDHTGWPYVSSLCLLLSLDGDQAFQCICNPMLAIWGGGVSR